MLVEAFIYPTMPTASICSDEVLWKRFKDTVISYQRERICIATTTRASTMLPYISNPRPFRFNVDGHNRFLSHVSAYRRSHVKVNREELDKMRSFGLLNPLAILQDDGHAVGKSLSHYFIDAYKRTA
jgi:UDP-3-O-acyl-N-acetylglucosamine deacetylase